MTTYAWEDPKIPALNYWAVHTEDVVPHGRDIDETVEDYLEDLDPADWPPVVTIIGFVAGEPLEDGEPGCLLDDVCKVTVSTAAFVRAYVPEWLGDEDVCSAVQRLAEVAS